MGIYNKEEEKNVLHWGCFIPIFIFATSFLLISLAHNSKTNREKEYISEISSKDSCLTANHLETENKLYLKFKREVNFLKEKLPQRLDDNTIIKDVEFIGNEITFEYSVSDYNDNVDRDKYQKLKRKIERDMLIHSMQEYSVLNLTFNFLYYNEEGERLFDFKLYGEYIDKRIDLYNVDGKLYIIPYDKESDFLSKHPNAKSPKDTTGTKYTYQDVIAQLEETTQKNNTNNITVYTLNDKRYNIPDSVVADFERDNPTATLAYQDGEDIYDIRVEQKDEFLKQFPNAKLYVDDDKEYNNTRWNQETCVYSDFKHGFSWRFPVSDWKLTSGNEKYTVFKIVETNTGVTAFVNINPIETDKSFPEDIFRIYDKMVQMEEQLEKQAERVTGQKTIQNHRKKALFGGKNAIKRRYITELVDDRYNEPLRAITYTYTFIYNKAIWSVTLKCHKQVYDLLLQQNLELEEIFKGFDFIHIQ